MYGTDKDKKNAAGAVWSAVRQGLSKYAWDGTLPDVCLALSHKTRIKVNELLNERAALAVEAKGLATWQLIAPLKCPGVSMQPQNFKMWVGAELLGCTRGREKKVLNAVTYRVVDITGDQVRLIVGEEFQTQNAEDQQLCGAEHREPKESDEDVNELTLSLEEVAKLMRPTHCLVYYTAQGRTFRNRTLLMLDVSARFFTLRHFIVGVSRVTSGEKYLRIASARQQEELMRQESVVIRANPINMRFSDCDFTK